LELVCQDALEDPFCLGVGWEGEVQDLELRLQSFGNLGSATTGRTHGCYKLDIHDLFEEFPLNSVIPPIVVKPLSDEFQSRLGALFFLGHIQVIYENHTFFAIRNHFVAGSFDEFAFNDFLDFETGGVGTEDQLLVNIGAFIEFLQKSIDQRCFAGASGAD